VVADKRLRQQFRRDYKSPISWPSKPSAFQKLAEIERAWEEVSEKLEERIDEERSEVVLQVEMARATFLDPFGEFLNMSDIILHKQTSDETRLNDKDPDDRIPEIIADDILDYFLEGLLYATEPVVDLRKYCTLKSKKRNEGNTNPKWIPDGLNSYINKWRKEDGNGSLRSELNARTWMHFLNISENSVYLRLKHGSISFLDLIRTLYCLLMRAMLVSRWYDSDVDVEGEDFIPLGQQEAIPGRSRMLRYFDGFIYLPLNNGDYQHYLLKTSSLGPTSVSIINDFCESLEDIKSTFIENTPGILFVPGYPTSDTISTEIYWRDIRRLYVTVLYLADFYEMFRLWDKSKIEKFLVYRTKE